MLSKNIPVPSINGPVLAISQIIINFMSSAAETELSGLFISAKAMVPLQNILMKMGWPQPPLPVQCDNSTAIGVTNKPWICAYGGSAAATPKTTFATTGHQETKTSPTTVQSIIPPCTIWPTGQLIQGKQVTPQLTTRVC